MWIIIVSNAVCAEYTRRHHPAQIAATRTTTMMDSTSNATGTTMMAQAQTTPTDRPRVCSRHNCRTETRVLVVMCSHRMRYNPRRGGQSRMPQQHARRRYFCEGYYSDPRYAYVNHGYRYGFACHDLHTMPRTVYPFGSSSRIGTKQEERRLSRSSPY